MMRSLDDDAIPRTPSMSNGNALAHPTVACFQTILGGRPEAASTAMHSPGERVSSAYNVGSLPSGNTVVLGGGRYLNARVIIDRVATFRIP